MSLEDLKKNLEHEKSIVSKMASINLQMQQAEESKKKVYLASLNALKGQLKILNDTIPELIKEISPVKKLSSGGPEEKKSKPKNSKIVRLSYVSPSTKEKKFITIAKEDKEKFVKELSLSESGLKGLKETEKREEGAKVSKPSKLAHFSNLVFRKISESIAGKFTNVKEDLKKANIRFTISTYVSIALFVSCLIFIFSLLAIVLASIINIGFLMWIWVPFILFAFSLIGFYFYPAMEKGSVEKRINEELPFATIYMAAIAGSNIEPVKIFKIIALSPDYPNVGLEIKKMVYQIEIYGYDLVTALKNAAAKTSNKKLSELFSGLASNIVSGGSLKSYLEKKAENLLGDYKLERQKYTTLAGTFMDIYISVLVAAPLVLMMMFIIMNVTGMGIGLTVGSILALAIGGISLVNIIFLVVLQIKQPST